MVSVRCPWCSERLQAADGDILSAALALHFHRRHGLVLPDPQMISGGRERPVSSLAETDEHRDEAASGSVAYSARMAEREGDLYGVEGPPQTIYLQRGNEEPFVECPFCGFEARGEDEDDLSASLKEHMRENNELEEGQSPRLVRKAGTPP